MPKKQNGIPSDSGDTMPKQPMPTTQEAWEQRLVSKAYTLVEKQLDDGTVSPLVLANVFKMGTEKYRLEREMLGRQNELLTAKTEAIHDSKANDVLYEEAMRAMREYSGHNDPKIEDLPNGY